MVKPINCYSGSTVHNARDVEVCTTALAMEGQFCMATKQDESSWRIECMSLGEEAATRGCAVSMGAKPSSFPSIQKFFKWLGF